MLIVWIGVMSSIVDLETHVSFTPNAMDCDEHVCSRNSYSCGDGQCVEWITRMAFQRFVNSKGRLFHQTEFKLHVRGKSASTRLGHSTVGYVGQMKVTMILGILHGIR